MKGVIILQCFNLLCLCIINVLAIINGQDAKEHEFPWVVSIGYRKNKSDEKSAITHWCTGTILTRIHILTAGHCAIGFPLDLYITAGGHNLNRDDGFKQVRELDEMQNYTDKIGYVDIALLTLKTPLNFNDKVRNLALPGIACAHQDEMVYAGYGYTEIPKDESQSSAVLQKSTVQLFDQESCKQKFKGSDKIIDYRLFCATEVGVTACIGDSGAAAVCTENGSNFFCGVVSFTGGDCSMDFPVVFSYLLDSVLEWIREKTDNDSDLQSYMCSVAEVVADDVSALEEPKKIQGFTDTLGNLWFKHRQTFFSICGMTAVVVFLVALFTWRPFRKIDQSLLEPEKTEGYVADQQTKEYENGKESKESATSDRNSHSNSEVQNLLVQPHKFQITMSA